MVKRVISFLILSIFLAHFAGFYIYFVVQLQQVRNEMRAKLKELPSEKLELITLSKHEYQLAKVEDHEIKVDGKMYDIARLKEEDGKILVYCLHDEAEDNLLAFLDKILSLPLKDKKVPSQLVVFTSLSFIVPAAFRWAGIPDDIFKNHTYYQLQSTCFFPTVDSPPPRFRMLS